MKKIFALLLAVLCIGSLVACKDEVSDLDPYKTALAASPVSAVIDDTMVYSGITLEAMYSIGYADGAATVNYTRDKLVEFDPNGAVPGADKTSVSGTATVDKDGNAQGDVGTLIANLVARKLNLDSGKMEYTFSGNALVANIGKGNTKAVFGVEIGSDTVLNIVSVGGKVSSVSVSYGSADATRVIVCSYTY